MVTTGTVQLTAMLVTLEVLTMPVPLLTVHVPLVGWLRTVTAYVAPVARGVGKVKGPLALRVI